MSEPPPYGPKAYETMQLGEDDRRRFAAIAELTARRAPDREIIVPARTGKAFAVRRGEVVRIECHQGSQVADLNVFSSDDPAEHFSSSQTRSVHGCHLTTGNRLWSHPIFQRPLMTIIADTVGNARQPGGGAAHDLLFGMCDERLYHRLTGRRGMPNCRDNLTAAVAELGLGAASVHDPFNIFMVTGVNGEDRLFYDPPTAKSGDYVDLHAEIDCLCAVSACPGASSGPSPGGLRLRFFDTSAA